VTAPLIVDPGSDLAGHVATAMATHAKSMRSAGIALPVGFPELLAVFTLRAREGQRVPTAAVFAAGGDPEPVDELIVSYDRAAAMLSCSVRTVKRLAAAGELPVVRIGALPRLRVRDIEAYVARAAGAAA
jgi:excisionase family DNA binding protein